MNVKLLCQLSFFTLAVTTTSLKAMHFPLLSSIEKMLVFREIQCKGISAVRQKIYRAKNPKPMVNNGHFGFKIPVVLHIETVVEKADKTRDPLTKAVFEEIEVIESESGYIPTHITITMNNAISVVMPTNYLGSDTRYYWLKDAVRIEARLTNKPELKEIVDSYNNTNE